MLVDVLRVLPFFFSSRRRHTRCALVTWSSDVCSSDLSPTRVVSIVYWALLRADEVDAQVAAHAEAGDAPENVEWFEAANLPRLAFDHNEIVRSEERRVGKECVSTCRSRWSPYH